MHRQTRACGVRVARDGRQRLFGPAVTLLVVALAIASGLTLHSSPAGNAPSARVAVSSLDTVLRGRPAHSGVRAPTPTRESWPSRLDTRAGLALLHATQTMPFVAKRFARTTIAGVRGPDEPTSTIDTNIPSPLVPRMPAPPPLGVVDVVVGSVTPFAATVSWRTSETAASRAAYGLAQPTMWTPASTAADHSAVLSGLAPGTSYRIWITADTPDGRVAASEASVTTRGLAQPAKATTSASALLIDGQPVFPTMVWGQCSGEYSGSLAAGINLFLRNPCGSSVEAATRLQGHAFVLADAFETSVAAPNVIGSFLPDEWDTFLPGDLTNAGAAQLVPEGAPTPRFLTLTNHFFSQAAPLPQQRGMYPALIETADVVGFDLYPLQNWCRNDAFAAVFDAQRELVALARGKPTFQWIESRVMDCDPGFAVTARTVRAETWLAVAGGAHAIGYFPYSWAPDVGAEIAAERREFDALTTALVEPATPVSVSDPAVKASARVHNGALYIIAVNSGTSARSVTLTFDAAADRELTTLDGAHVVAASDGSFTEAFEPLGVHIYVAPPEA